MKTTHLVLSITAVCLSANAFSQSYTGAEATPFTQQTNEKVKKELPLANRQDFTDATRGFIATINVPYIKGEDGGSAYDLRAWDFLDDEAPSTVNPSLWRQSQLNKIHGLFEVLPNQIYQIRGFDIANMTFIRSRKGWIVIDVLTSKESAQAGYNLIKEQIADLPIKAVIITHPHADHFSGLEAILESAPNKDKSKIEIITPLGYFSDAISENLMAGVAMQRRARYMFGPLLPKNVKGNVGSGLGQVTSSGKKVVPLPTREIPDEGETLKIDGLTMEFISVPGAEAPSEIMIYLPQMKAFCVAEEINHTMHNLLTPRGAKVRDGQLWSKYIDQAIVNYGDKTEVSFSTHHWPTWGKTNVISYWEKQRDMYRYLHDQTLHLANKGYTPKEIAEMVKLPESISQDFANREYYGTISHNTKAQYQMYFGWFDGIPANLNPLPPTEESSKYVEAIGGETAVMIKAKEAFDKGEYRWTATLLNHLVFASPSNKEARELLADTYCQMGYQAESGAWRNFYLQGAKELIEGVKQIGKGSANLSALISNLTPEMIFDMLAIQVNGEKAADKDLVLNIKLTDTKECATLILKNGALSNRIGKLHAHPTATISGSKQTIGNSLTQPQLIPKNRENGTLLIEGEANALLTLVSVLEPSDPDFNIIEP